MFPQAPGPAVYPASKLRHGKMLKDVLNRANIQCAAHWPELVGKISDSTLNAPVFWRRNMMDVANCDMVLLYAEEGDKLRGALVEAGAAFMATKPVIVVGDHQDYGTWKYYPGVLQATDLNHAIWIVKTMSGIPYNYSDMGHPNAH